MSGTSLFNSRVLLISGKGGVGRTTVTAAMAKAAARQGKAVLVAEVGEAGSADEECSALAHAFGQQRLTEKPVRLAHRIDGCHLWPREGHALFLSQILPAETLVRTALRSKALRRFLVAVPSFQEMGIFYHLLTLMQARVDQRSYRYDVVIVDMPATGHTLALTGLPDVLLKLIPYGPIAKLLREGQSLFYDPNQAKAWVVTVPEILPVTEAIELVNGLSEGKIQIGGIILNQFPENVFSEAEEQCLTALLAGDTRLQGARSFQRLQSSRKVREMLTAETSLPMTVLPQSEHEGVRLSETLAEYLMGEESH